MSSYSQDICIKYFILIYYIIIIGAKQYNCDDVLSSYEWNFSMKIWGLLSPPSHITYFSYDLGSQPVGPKLALFSSSLPYSTQLKQNCPGFELSRAKLKACFVLGDLNASLKNYIAKSIPNINTSSTVYIKGNHCPHELCKKFVKETIFNIWRNEKYFSV